MIETGQVDRLTQDAVSRVRLGWLSSYDERGLARFLSESNAPALWIPSTGEYALGGYWRGRPDIGLLVETGARRNRLVLTEALVSAFAEQGCRAAVLSVSESWREGRWYRQNNFGDIDRIVTMVRSRLLEAPPPRYVRPEMDIRPYDPADLHALTAVDRASFPWLWWNDPKDFTTYTERADVFAYSGWVDGELVSYASSSVRPGRAHLDRLAVRQQDQGKGYGRAMLSAMLQEMERRGAREVALTTQTINETAQTLYRSVGFRLTHEVEPIVGRYLQPHADAPSAGRSADL